MRSKVALAAVLVLAASVQAVDDPITFSTPVVVNSNDFGLEPVIQVNTTNGLWVAATTNVDVWDGDESWLAYNASGSFNSWTVEDPATSGGGDAVVFTNATNITFAELSQGGIKVAVRAPGGWGGVPVSTISGTNDREWFAEHSGILYMSHTDSSSSPKKLKVRQAPTWDLVEGVENIAEGDVSIGLPMVINQTGGIFVPYKKRMGRCTWQTPQTEERHGRALKS